MTHAPGVPASAGNAAGEAASPDRKRCAMRLGMRSTVRVCDGLLIAGLVVAVVGVGVVLAALSGSDGSLESAPIVRLTLPPAITAPA